MVFNNINQDYETVLQDIYSIPIDKKAIEFINWFSDEVREFYIISAGCKYYIDILVGKYGIKDKVKVIANPGFYENGEIYMIPDKSKYSEFLELTKERLLKS